MTAPCLYDRAGLPGAEGEEAAAELLGRDTEYAIRSDRAKKGAAHRRRCKRDGCGSWLAKGELYCPSHRGDDLPF
jgi:hypothetical protein